MDKNKRPSDVSFISIKMILNFTAFSSKKLKKLWIINVSFYTFVRGSIQNLVCFQM